MSASAQSRCSSAAAGSAQQRRGAARSVRGERGSLRAVRLAPRRTARVATRASYKDEGPDESTNLKDLRADIDFYLTQKNKADVQAVENAADLEVGSEFMTDEEARGYCQRVVKVLKVLKDKRRMGLSEIQLTIEIEQPEELERNKVLGIENVPSREERALALSRVIDGKIPENRVALKLLTEELESWPFLDEAGEQQPEASSVSPYEQLNSAQGGEWGAPKRRMGRDPNEKPQSVMDMLPDWVGYSALYLISAIPVIITVTVIAILFFSSLK